NRDRELLTPAALDLAAPTTVGEHAPLHILAEAVWEAEDLALAPDGRLLAWALNENGYSRLVFHDLYASVTLASPPLPQGVVEGLTWSPDGSRVAFGFNGTRHNGNIWLATPTRTSDTDDQRQQFTSAHAVGAESNETATVRQLSFVPGAGDDPTMLVEPELIRYTSFDGLQIPAYYYRPYDHSRAAEAGLSVIV